MAEGPPIPPNELGVETPKNITFEELLQKRSNHDIAILIQKHPSILNENILKLLSELNVPSEIISLLKADTSRFTKNRNLAHMLRLLGRQGVEREFAIAFIENTASIWEESEKAIREEGYDSEHNLQNANFILGAEGSNTTLFWTFAPYLFRELTNRGLDQSRAIKTILVWAKKAEKTVDHKRPKFHVSLQGLEFTNKYPADKEYVLSPNPEDISHKFTVQTAKHIADLLLPKEQK